MPENTEEEAGGPWSPIPTDDWGEASRGHEHDRYTELGPPDIDPGPPPAPPRVPTEDMELPNPFVIKDVIEKFGAENNDLTGYRGKGSTEGFNVTPATLMDLMAFLGVDPDGRLYGEMEGLADAAEEGPGGPSTSSWADVQRLLEKVPNPVDAFFGDSVERFPDQDISIDMLRRLASAEPERFQAAWSLIIGNRDARIPGYAPNPGLKQLYDEFIADNADPAVFARGLGFDAKTVDTGGAFEDSVFEAPEGSIAGRAEMLGIFGTSEETTSIETRMFDLAHSPEAIETGQIDALEAELAEETNKNLGLYSEKTLREINSLIGASMPFNKTSISTSADLNGWLNDAILGKETSKGRVGGHAQGRFYGQRTQFTDTADIYGAHRGLNENRLYAQENQDLTFDVNFGQGTLAGYQSGADNMFGLREGALADRLSANQIASGIVEPMGAGESLLGTAGVQSLGQAQSDVRNKGGETYNQWRFKINQMSQGRGSEIEDLQRALWSMGYFGSGAIARGEIPNWGYLDERTQVAHAEFGIDIYRSTSKDASVVGKLARERTMPLFEALRQDMVASGAGGPEIIDRAAVAATFKIYMDEALDVSVQDAAKGEDGIGQRLSKKEAEAIKDAFREFEDQMIGESYAQQQKQANQAYDRQKASAHRNQFRTGAGLDRKFDEYGELITNIRNPSGGLHPGQTFGEHRGNPNVGIVEPVTDSKGNVFQPGKRSAWTGGQDGLHSDPSGGMSPNFGADGSLGQQDSLVKVEQADPQAVIRAQLRKRQGDKLFARSVGNGVGVLRGMISGAIK